MKIKKGSDIVDVGHKIYSETTPCLSLNPAGQGTMADLSTQLFYTFQVKIRNCSTHPELVTMITQTANNFMNWFDPYEFDIPTNETKELGFYTIVPVPTNPGAYLIDFKGDALWNFFGTKVIVTSTLGKATVIVRPP